MNPLAAWLMAAVVAAGPALAQGSTDADDALQASTRAQPDLRWRFELAPRTGVAPPEWRRDAPARVADNESRLWFGGAHTQLGIALQSDGLHRGMLLRTQVDADTTLALRLRGGQLRIVLAVRLNGMN
jgi:hypothetical protein